MAKFEITRLEALNTVNGALREWMNTDQITANPADVAIALEVVGNMITQLSKDKLPTGESETAVANKTIANNFLAHCVANGMSEFTNDDLRQWAHVNAQKGTAIVRAGVVAGVWVRKPDSFKTAVYMLR